MPLRQRRVWAFGGACALVAAALAGCLHESPHDATPQAAAPTAQPTIADFMPAVKPDPAAEKIAAADYTDHVIPLMTQYCYGCHNSEKHVADLALDQFTTADSILKNRETWDQVSKYVRTHQMPPDKAKQPSDADRAIISQWVDTRLFAYYAAHPDPGRVTIHRLNKSEYNNTIRDLVGVDFQPAEDFPQDDLGYGFDNIGDVLSLPPVLMEKYLSAADRILDDALPTEPPARRVRHFSTSQAEIGFNALGDRGDGWAHLISLEEDDYAVEIPVPAGDYLVRVKAFCEPTGGSVIGQGSSVVTLPQGKPEPTKLGVFVGSTFVQDLTIDATEKDPKVYEARVGVPAGKQRFRVAVRRNRGGDNETYMLNGRIGKQQPGIVYVRYIEIDGPLPAAITRIPADQLQLTGQGTFNSRGGRVLEHNGDVATTINVPKAGEYILRAQACGNQAGTEPPKMEFRVNGAPIKTFDVIAPDTLLPLQGQRLFDINLLNARPYVYEVHAQLPAGQVRFSAAFTNDFADPANANPNLRDRNLIVDYLEAVDLNRPLPPPPVPPTFAQYLTTKVTPANRDATARQILTTFTSRAFRRPAKPAELDRLMSLFTMASGDGESFENSLKLSLKAVLVAPQFLFRGGIIPNPNNPDSIHIIDEYALAARLSYFLWSSTPDDELLALAQRHELRKNLPAQVKRMLASPKSAALEENFASQWLGLRNLSNLAPDKDLFKDFDDSLRKSMARETELFFDHIVRDDRDVMELLTADYTFVNARLARFYGFDTISGENFQQVSLAGTPRRGILTQASILTLTSNPTRTSPVKRGKFVLESLLGTPPPPPPPDVPKLDEEAKTVSGTLRHQMEVHRENAICASCHAQMDPIGFGLENFDAIGKWRDTDGSQPIDAAGILKTGEQFKTAAELTAILADKRGDDFLHCLSEKMLTYALGRGVESYDRPAVEKIVTGLKANNRKFSALVMQVVQSMPFQMQRGEAPAE